MLIVERLALLLVDGSTGASVVEPDRRRRALATAYLVDLCEAGLLDLVVRGDDVRLVRGPVRANRDAYAVRAAERVLGFEPTPLPNAARALRSGLVRHVYARLAAVGDVRRLGGWGGRRYVLLDGGRGAATRSALREVLLDGREPSREEHVVVAILGALGVAGLAAAVTGEDATAADARGAALAERSIADGGVNGAGRWGMADMLLGEPTIGEQAVVDNELLMYWLNDARAYVRLVRRGAGP